MRRIGICGVIVCALTLALPALAQDPSAQQPVSRVVIDLPQGQTFWPDLSISPDSTQVAYIARTGSGADSLQLYVRRLNELESRPIPGTAGAFFVPKCTETQSEMREARVIHCQGRRSLF